MLISSDPNRDKPVPYLEIQHYPVVKTFCSCKSAYRTSKISKVAAETNQKTGTDTITRSRGPNDGIKRWMEIVSMVTRLRVGARPHLFLRVASLEISRGIP